MPYEIDRDALRQTIDQIVDFAEAQPVPEEIAEMAIAQGPAAVEALYVAWLATCLTFGVEDGILQRLDRFIRPV